MAKPVKANRSSKLMRDPLEDESLYIPKETLPEGTSQDLTSHGYNVLTNSRILPGKAEIVSPLLPAGSETVPRSKVTNIIKEGIPGQGQFGDGVIVESSGDKEVLSDERASKRVAIKLLSDKMEAVYHSIDINDMGVDDVVTTPLDASDAALLNGRTLDNLRSRAGEVDKYLNGTNGLGQVWGRNNPGRSWEDALKSASKEDLQNDPDLRLIKQNKDRLDNINRSIDGLQKSTNGIASEEMEKLKYLFTSEKPIKQSDDPRTHMAQVLPQDQDTPKPTAKATEEPFVPVGPTIDPTELLIRNKQEEEKATMSRLRGEIDPLMSELEALANKHNTGEMLTRRRMSGKFENYYMTSELYREKEALLMGRVNKLIDNSTSLNKEALKNWYAMKASKFDEGLDPIGPTGHPGLVAIKNMALDVADLVVPEKTKLGKVINEERNIAYTNKDTVEAMHEFYAIASSVVGGVGIATKISSAISTSTKIGALSSIGRSVVGAGKFVAASVAGDAVGTLMYNGLKETDVSTAEFLLGMGISEKVIPDILSYAPDDPRWETIVKDIATNSAIGLAVSGIVAKPLQMAARAKAANAIVADIKFRIAARKEIVANLKTFLEANPHLARSKTYAPFLARDTVDQVLENLGASGEKSIPKGKRMEEALRIIKERIEQAETVKGAPKAPHNPLSDTEITDLAKVLEEVTGEKFQLDKSLGTIDNLEALSDAKIRRMTLYVAGKVKEVTSKARSKIADEILKEIEQTKITQLERIRPLEIDSKKEWQSFYGTVGEVNSTLEFGVSVGLITEQEAKDASLHTFLWKKHFNDTTKGYNAFADKIKKIKERHVGDDAIEALYKDPELKEAFGGLAKDLRVAKEGAAGTWGGLANKANNSYVMYLLSDLPNRVLDAGSTRLNQLVLSLSDEKPLERAVENLMKYRGKVLQRGFSSITPTVSQLDIASHGGNTVYKLMLAADEPVKQAIYKAFVDSMADKLVNAGVIKNPREFTAAFYREVEEGGIEIVRNSQAGHIRRNYYSDVIGAMDEAASTIEKRMVNDMSVSDLPSPNMLDMADRTYEGIKKLKGKTINEFFKSEVRGLDISFEEFDKLAAEAALIPSFQGGTQGTFSTIGNWLPYAAQKGGFEGLSPYAQFVGRFTRTAGNISQTAWDLSGLGLAQSGLSKGIESATGKTLHPALRGGIHNDLVSGNPKRVFMGKVKLGVASLATLQSVNYLLSLSDEEFFNAEELDFESINKGERIGAKLAPQMQPFNHVLFEAVKKIRKGEEVPDNMMDALTTYAAAASSAFLEFWEKENMSEMPVLDDILETGSNILTTMRYSLQDKQSAGGDEDKLTSTDKDFEYMRDRAMDTVVDYATSSFLGFFGLVGDVAMMAKKTITSPTAKQFYPDQPILKRHSGKFLDRAWGEVTGESQVHTGPFGLWENPAGFDSKTNLFGEPIIMKDGEVPRPFGRNIPGDKLGLDVSNIMTEPFGITKNHTINGELFRFEDLKDLETGKSLQSILLENLKKHNIRGKVQSIMDRKDNNDAQKEASIREEIRRLVNGEAYNLLPRARKAKGKPEAKPKSK